jgi:hypothetical protein
MFLTLLAKLTQIVVCANSYKSGEYYNDENLIKAEMVVRRDYSADAWSP